MYTSEELCAMDHPWDLWYTVEEGLYEMLEKICPFSAESLAEVGLIEDLTGCWKVFRPSIRHHKQLRIVYLRRHPYRFGYRLNRLR